MSRDTTYEVNNGFDFNTPMQNNYQVQDTDDGDMVFS
jgi:hypothetical protein